MSTFDTEKALELYNKGQDYNKISKLLNVKGSTLRMFFSKNISLGKIKRRKEIGAREYVRPKLKEIRLKNNFTQNNVAKLAGITRSYYNRLENYNRGPSYDVAKKIKSVLQYYDDDLFDVIKNEEKS